MIFSMRYFGCNVLIMKNIFRERLNSERPYCYLKFKPRVKRILVKEENSLLRLHFYQADHPVHHFYLPAVCNTDISGTSVFLWTITYTTKHRTSIQEIVPLTQILWLSSNFLNITVIATKSRSSE